MNVTERYVLDQAAQQLQAEGFSVFVEPDARMLPAFMGKYRPDAIAIRPDRNLAIEIKSEDAKGGDALENIARLFQGRTDWGLRIHYARPSSTNVVTTTGSTSAVETTIVEVEALIEEGRDRAALLLAWAAFEAEARLWLSTDLKWPQTIANLLEIIAGEGHVTPEEADLIRRMAANRNQIIHGNLELAVSRADLQAFVLTLKNLSGLEKEKMRNRPLAAF
jgi:uncharacterized protein YutE (UPF0331/DUF86 family)